MDGPRRRHPDKGHPPQLVRIPTLARIRRQGSCTSNRFFHQRSKKGAEGLYTYEELIDGESHRGMLNLADPYQEKLKLEATVPRAPESERRSEIKRRRWSPGEISILRNGIRDGIDAATLHRQKFPYRSLRSVEHMVQRRKRTVKKTPGGMPGALDRSSEGPMLSDDIPGGTGPFDVVEDDVEDDVEVDDRAQMPAGADDSRDQTPPQVPATLDAADPTLADGFDFASVRTAYVKLPAHAATMTATAEKPGRLRRPSAAKRRFAHAPQTTANEGPSTVMPGPISQSASEDDPPVAPEPEPKRRALFGDWSQEERWRDCMRKSGGDERLARRFLQDMNMTTDMFDAVLRKDEEAIASIRAERAQKELRWAIEDGRARRKQPAQGEPVVVNAEDIDDEVLREEDWEVDEEEDDDYMMDIQEDDPYDFQDSEDDMIRDREFEEIEDDEDEDALPVFAGRQTPVQVMQATVMGDGLPTPTRTIEKLMAFGIDSKQPTSSLPTTAPSETTMASTSRESDMSKSKRARRRARNTESRRQSGGARNKTASDRKSMSSFATPVVPVAAKKEKQKKAQPAKPLEQASSTSSSYGVEADNPFMTIVRNAHIPTPPRRRFEPARRRGTPSPPAWFANDDDEDDSDSNAGSE